MIYAEARELRAAKARKRICLVKNDKPKFITRLKAELEPLGGLKAKEGNSHEPRN